MIARQSADQSKFLRQHRTTGTRRPEQNAARADEALGVFWAQAVSLVRKAMADSAVLSLETDLALNDTLVTIDVRLSHQLCGFGV
jgi:hypothetical protein